MFNWSPQFYSHPFRSLYELQLILWQFLLLQKTAFNSYPNKNWKWNCKGENIQIFSSEIILACENESQDLNYGQILNSKCLKSLCHSGSHGLSAIRARRTKSRGPKGLQLEVGARRAPRLLVSNMFQIQNAQDIPNLAQTMVIGGQ